MLSLIRDAEPTDMDHLQEVFRRASLSNENDRGLLRDHPEWLVLSDQGVREGRTRVAVDKEGTVTGFATYLISNGVAELEDLFVDPPRMRQGIATALVLAISARLTELGFEYLEVTANPHAMAFYERVGFVAGQIVPTPGYPATRMRRPTAHLTERHPLPASRDIQRLCTTDLLGSMGLIAVVDTPGSLNTRRCDRDCKR